MNILSTQSHTKPVSPPYIKKYFASLAISCDRIFKQISLQNLATLQTIADMDKVNCVFESIDDVYTCTVQDVTTFPAK